MVILVMGVSGSGKSTIGQLLAESLHWQFSDADAFHASESIAKMQKNIPLLDSDRMPWLMQLQTAIDNWLKTDQNVILACSVLKDSYRQLLWRDPQRMRLVYLKGPEKLIQQRLQSRYNHFMSADLLDTQLDILEEPKTALYVDISDSPLEIVAQIQTYLQLQP